MHALIRVNKTNSARNKGGAMAKELQKNIDKTTTGNDNITI